MQVSVVRQPEMTLRVTDSTVPIAHTTVYLYWISEPYSRLEQSQTFETNAEGTVRLEQMLQTDTAFPLALHGVKAYQHKLCIEAPGYRTLLITMVVLRGEKVQLDTPLTPGENLAVCGSYDALNHPPGVPRPDISAQHESIKGAYEITE